MGMTGVLDVFPKLGYSLESQTGRHSYPHSLDAVLTGKECKWPSTESMHTNFKKSALAISDRKAFVFGKTKTKPCNILYTHPKPT